MGPQRIFPRSAADSFLVFLHKACAALAFRSEKFGDLIKGCETLIIKDGQVQEKAMRAGHITKKDLLEELRQEGNVSSPIEVKTAFLEWNGKISVLPMDAMD